MFTALIITATPERGRQIRGLALSSGEIEILRDLDRFPSDFELHRLLELAPDLVLLDLAAGRRAVECALVIQNRFPETAVIGHGPATEAIPGTGFSALLADGANVADLRIAITEAVHAVKGGVEPNLFSFLPSKAGSGASTVVLNTAAALAAQFGRKVLVLDADLRSGIQDLLLNLAPGRSIQHLLDGETQIDEFRWRNTVVKSQGVDFLLSSRSLDTQAPMWGPYFRILNFARSRYDTILADLPELVNPATVELVRRSWIVFPVCTSEIPSLTLARQRCDELAKWDVPNERIGVLLNRLQRTDPALSEFAALLGRPVMQTFPNDYPLVKSSLMAGGPVPVDSPLGKAFTGFARLLLGSQADQPPAAKPTLTGKLKGFLRRTGS